MRALPDHFFYSDQVEDVASRRYLFSREEARHASKVLRLQPGDQLRWTDGAGNRYLGRLEAVDRDAMHATVLEHEIVPTRRRVQLGVGTLHDANRMEWLVEKATELGATEITLLTTARTERPSYRLARLRSKALAALKQSGRAYLPPIREAAFGDTLTESADPDRLRCIAHCYSALPRSPFERIVERLGENLRAIDLLIGPEGDFTEEEIVQAEAAGFTSVSLGTARLRTETAALAALAGISASAPAAP